MSAPKNVIDMRPGKGFTTSQSNEHLRRMADKESAKKAQWNHDPSREYLNFEIGKGGVVKEVDKTKSIPQRIKENLEAREIKDPNISLINQGKNPYYRTVANFILGGNREVMRNLAFGNQKVNWEHGADNSDLKRMPEIEAWAKDAYAFMCKKYGEQNIAAFVVHLDETNPHCHCTVLPITKKNKFSFFGVFLKGNNTKDALSEYMDSLHTEYADEVGLKYGMNEGIALRKPVPFIVPQKSIAENSGRMLRRRKKRFEKTPKPSNSKIQRLPISVELLLHLAGKSSTLLLV